MSYTVFYIDDLFNPYEGAIVQLQKPLLYIGAASSSMLDFGKTLKSLSLTSRLQIYYVQRTLCFRGYIIGITSDNNIISDPFRAPNSAWRVAVKYYDIIKYTNFYFFLADERC